MIGLPHRIAAFEAALEPVAAAGRAWVTTATTIAAAYRAQLPTRPPA